MTGAETPVWLECRNQGELLRKGYRDRLGFIGQDKEFAVPSRSHWKRASGWHISKPTPAVIWKWIVLTHTHTHAHTHTHTQTHVPHAHANLGTSPESIRTPKGRAPPQTHIQG